MMMESLLLPGAGDDTSSDGRREPRLLPAGDVAPSSRSFLIANCGIFCSVVV